MPRLLRALPCLCLLLLAGLVCTEARAQTGVLRGFVSDEADGTPLIGANVVLESSTGRVTGSATDTDGVYAISGLQAGRYALRATFLGYQPFTDTLLIEPGVRSYNIELTPDESELGEVLVESERTSGAANVTAGLQRIRAEDIELVPTPDVSGDLASYLTTLPGVVSTGDQGGQLFIRGGEPTQNLVLLDGMPLYQPFHVLGFYSAFPSDIVSRADVYAGGYPARFGGQLSSVLDVQTRTGNLRSFRAAASVAPFVSGARIEGPLIPGSLSFLANGRVSVIEQGAERVVDRDLPYSFGDVFGKLHAQITSNSRLSLSGIYTYDRGIIGDTASARPDEVRWSNAAIGSRYLFLPTAFPFRSEILLSLSQLQTEVGPRDDANRFSDISRFRAEVNLTYFLDRFDLDLGGYVETLDVDTRLDGLYQNVADFAESNTEAGLYLTPEFRTPFGLTLHPGLRLVASPSKNFTFVEPRFRAIWKGGPHQISTAAGVYHQTLVGLSDRRDATSIFTAWTAIPSGKVPTAYHAIVGYRITPTPWLDLAMEGFYKKLENLSIAEWTATPRLTTNLQDASGEVLGMDARVEVRAGRWYAYFNYGLSSVEYAAEQPFYELWFGEGELVFRPPHDRRHQVNGLISAEVAGFEASVRWQFGSGLPFSRALGFDVFINPSEGIDPFTMPGQPRVIYERPYNSELPTYHRLDISVERVFDLGPAELTAQVGVINAYDRRNLFAYDTFTLRRSDQLPLIPTAGLKVSY